MRERKENRELNIPEFVGSSFAKSLTGTQLTVPRMSLSIGAVHFPLFPPPGSQPIHLPCRAANEASPRCRRQIVAEKPKISRPGCYGAECWGIVIGTRDVYDLLF